MGLNILSVNSMNSLATRNLNIGNSISSLNQGFINNRRNNNTATNSVFNHAVDASISDESRVRYIRSQTLRENNKATDIRQPIRVQQPQQATGPPRNVNFSEFLSEKLSGIVSNYNEVASEIANKIMGGRNLSSEERVANRQVALAMAEHIAESYFNDVESATEFLAEVNRRMDGESLRDRGYVDRGFDGNFIRPYMCVVGSGHVNPVSAFLIHHLGFSNEDMRGITLDMLRNEIWPKFHEAFVNDVQNGTNVIASAVQQVSGTFERRNEEIEKIHNEVETLFDIMRIGENLVEDLSVLLYSLNRPELSDWTNNLLSMLSEQ